MLLLFGIILSISRLCCVTGFTPLTEYQYDYIGHTTLKGLGTFAVNAEVSYIFT